MILPLQRKLKLTESNCTRQQRKSTPTCIMQLFLMLMTWKNKGLKTLQKSYREWHLWGKRVYVLLCYGATILVECLVQMRHQKVFSQCLSCFWSQGLDELTGWDFILTVRGECREQQSWQLTQVQLPEWRTVSHTEVFHRAPRDAFQACNVTRPPALPRPNWLQPSAMQTNR